MWFGVSNTQSFVTVSIFRLLNLKFKMCIYISASIFYSMENIILSGNQFNGIPSKCILDQHINHAPFLDLRSHLASTSKSCIFMCLPHCQFVMHIKAHSFHATIDSCIYNFIEYYRFYKNIYDDNTISRRA